MGLSLGRLMHMSRRIHVLDWEPWNDNEFEKRVLKILQMGSEEITSLEFLELFDAFQMIKTKKNDIKDGKIKSDIHQKISRRYHNISAEKIHKEFHSLFTYKEHDYHEFCHSLLQVFEEYKWHKVFQEHDLNRILEAGRIRIQNFLKTEYWGKYYSSVVKKLFLSKAKNFELLLDNFTDSNTKYMIPSNISKQEFYDLAVRYIDGEADSEANVNYLRLIQGGLSGLGKHLNLDAMLRLKIKNEINRQIDKHFSENEGYKESYAIYGNWSDFIKENPDNEIRGYVDVEFLRTYSDIPTLLNSVQYFHWFLNINGIWNLVSFPNLEADIFSSLLGIKSNHHYEMSFFFSSKQRIVLNELRVMRGVLQQEHHVEFEDIFNYFFLEYSKQVLHLDWLPIEFSKSVSYGAKVSLMFIAEENLRKQWYAFTKYGDIQHDLVNLTSTPRFKDLKSVIPNKYVYVHSEKMIKINNLLFSTQSHLGYINQNLQADTFIDLLQNNKVSYSDFSPYQTENIDFLVEEEIITVRENDEIFVTNQQAQFILICRFLWSYGVINYYNFPFAEVGDSATEYQNLINTKVEQGYLKTESTLFSEPEINYLNYLLNNSEYDNAKALRNKHNHSYVAEKDEDNLEDYLYASAVIFVYIIKINEEIHLKNLLEGKEGFWMER